MKMGLVMKLALAVIILFLFVGVVAPFVSSAYPLVITRNDTSLDLPTSPLLYAVFHKNDGGMDRIDFRKFSKEEQISAMYTLVPYSPYEKNLDEILFPPSLDRFGHYMGTDDVGRDIAARMVYGSRNSMMVGLVAMSIAVVIGLLVGSVAGYFGGWVDMVLSRLIEIVITFPRLILIMAVLTILKPSLFYVMIVIGVTGWTGIARIVRAEFLKRKTLEYVQSARVQGASHMRIIWVHILPNSMAPVLVLISFGIAGTVLLESSLSFLGIGVQPPESSWGQILDMSKAYMDFAWWLIFFPGFAIFLIVVSYNLLGDYIRRYLSPRERQN
ncbi:MAG: ABC transporter permease [Leptospirales bacterium]